MAVTSSIQDAIYDTDGSSVAFPIPFYFLVDGHVAVDKLDSNGNTVPLILGTDYTVSGAGNELGGALGTTIVYPVGYKLRIYRVVPVTQETEYQQNDPFPAKATERALDKLTMIAQQNSSAAQNSIRYPRNEYGGNGELPAKPNRINTLLGFDSLGAQVLMPLSASVGAGDLKNEIWVDGIDYTSGVSNRVLLSRNYTTKANLGAVVMMGVTQDPDSYGIVDGYLVFNAVIPAGISKIWCYGGTTLSLNAPAQNSVGDDELTWGSILARQVDSLTAARALPALRYGRVKLNGYYTKGDGGGGAEYYYDPTDLSTSDDGFSCYHASDGGRMKILQQAVYSVRQAGAKSDSTGTGLGTDSHAAIQACLDFAKSHEADVYVYGRFRSSLGLALDYSADTTVFGSRTSIKGGSSRQAVIYFDDGAFNGLTVTGNIAGGAVSMMRIEGISLVKNDRNNTGLLLNGHSHIAVRDVMGQGWNTGLWGFDIQESCFENVYMQYNNGGAKFQKNAFTQPNAITFKDCTFGLNDLYGLDMINPAACVFIGGSIESNGVTHTGTDTNSVWGARVIVDTALTEGSIAMTFLSAYIENNGTPVAGVGAADIWYVNSACDSALAIENCTFQRHSRFCTNCIKVDTSGGFRHKIRIKSFFKGYGDYTPNASRPYWQVVNSTDPVDVDDRGSQYGSSTEAPNYNGTGVGRVFSTQSDIGGSARFNGTNAVITSAFGVASVTRTSTGTYTVAFARSQPAIGSRIYGSMLSDLGAVRLVSETANGAVFQTVNLAGAVTDFANVMVWWAADPSA